MGTAGFCISIQSGPLGPQAVTDANGIYTSDDFCTKHMVEFGAFKEGYKQNMISIDRFVPGKTFEFF